MRILHICDSINPDGLGGYESYLHYLSKELSSLGYESFIVTQASKKDSPSVTHEGNYTIYWISGNYLEARKWEFLSLPESDRVEQVNQFFTDDDLEENVKILQSQLIEVVKEVRPDIIHAHSTYIVFNRVLMALLRREMLQGIGLVATIHGLPKKLIIPGDIRTTDYEQLATYYPFDIVLGVSDTVASALRDKLKESGKDYTVRRLYIGINTEVFKPDKSVNKEWDIAFMGRLESMKGVDVFPEMLRIVRKKHPKLRMVMTGEGSLKESLLQQLKTREVEDMVDYLGVIETERVPELINQSKIFLYPSRREPFGLSVLEGMACEVPVITANVYGPSEVVTHEKDGYAINPGEPQVLADAIDRLLTDTDLYNTLRSNSRRTVLEKFDIKFHVPKLLDIYHEIQKEK